jgi:hypothetical protein
MNHANALTKIRLALAAIEAIANNTSCPDTGEGGCIGGPIPGYGCVHEAARSAARRLVEVNTMLERED